MARDLRVTERYDLLLCRGIDSTAGGKDLRCRLCIRLAGRWPDPVRRVSATAVEPLYDPSRLIDGHCHALLVGDPSETAP